MNEFQVDLTHPNPVHTLRNDDSIAITAIDDSITYREFNIRIREVAEILSSHGLTDKHRILVVGDSEDMISTIVWTYGAIYLGVSPSNASTDQSDAEIELKADSGNVDAILNIDGRIKFRSDLTKTTKIQPEERSLMYTSGTTKKPKGKYTAEPQFFTYHSTWRKGLASTDQLRISYRLLGEEVPIRQLSAHPWDVGYGAYNVVNSLFTGGIYHWVQDEYDIPEAQSKYKTNFMSNYPLAYDRICDAGVCDPSIDVVELSGGACEPDAVERIRKALNPKVICNSFSSSGSGILLIRPVYPEDDPSICEWVHSTDLDPTLKIKLDEIGRLWYSRSDSPWETDNDLFERKGDYYRVTGRANDEFLLFGGGKISTWEIEGYANELAKPIFGCGEHMYCFKLNGLDGFDHHGLIYSGPLDINLLKKRMDKLIKYKRPDRIYQVKEEFWALNIKISRDHMSERIGNNREYIVSEI